MKRIFDIVFSSIAILVLSPLFAIVSVIILITMGRPIFYTQTRVGKNRKKFCLFKFRSMVRNADDLKKGMTFQNEACFPFFKVKNDFRITPFGKFLRRTSIDELPQLFNVLKGDMSIVGLRPVLPEEAEHLPDERFSVEAGLTGATQIYRDRKLSLSEIALIERKYVQSPNRFLADLNIFLRTFRVIFKGE